MKWKARLERLWHQRGDIPGWVLVTVMTAGLVTAVWLLAEGKLVGVLSTAITKTALN